MRRTAGSSLRGFESDVDRPDGKCFARAGVAGAASAAEIRWIYGGARIGRPENIVHAVAGGAIRDALRTGARCESMKTVVECGNAIGGKVVARFEARVAVAAPASYERHTRGINGASRDPGARE